MSHDDAASTKLMQRLVAVLAALHAGPLPRDELFAQLGTAYPSAAESRRVMVARDLKYLRELGIVIDKTRTRPPIFTLCGGPPAYTADDLRTLALIRDSFGTRHPQSAAISTLLATLTLGLDQEQYGTYARHPTSRAPLDPAIDYTSHAATIARLEQARSRCEIITFDYLNTQGQRSEHQAEPYDIEYYERHFYLVAYSFATHQMLDYRIDRVSNINLVQTLPPHLSHTKQRATVTFCYRLDARLAREPMSQRFENQRIIERLANGDAIIEAEGRSDFFIIQLLLRYRSMAELLGPPWLREKMAAEVRRLAEMYKD